MTELALAGVPLGTVLLIGVIVPPGSPRRPQGPRLQDAIPRASYLLGLAYLLLGKSALG